MNDDELRERLHAMPEPTATIDVDAVVADARRRRRPKVVGVGVAVGAACLAFLAPVVVPGLLGPDPVTATLQEQGAADQAPAASDAGGDDAAEPTGPSVLGAPDEDAATQSPITDVGACDVAPAAQTQPGLALTFESAPVGGAATLVVENVGDEMLVVRLGDVGVARVDGTSVIEASAVDPASSVPGLLVRLAPGDLERLGVDVVGDPTACGTATSSAGDLVPVVAIATGASAVVQTPAVGTVAID